MAIKIFTYRGRTLQQLLELNDKEFLQLLPSRQRRTMLREQSVKHQKLLQDIAKNKRNLETHCRDIVILPRMVGKTIKVHNGKTFMPVIIVEEMIGHVLGEFALTRSKVMHNAPGIGATRSSSAISVR
ncbi:MAG: 30S ribosomal protein S19 [Nanoarchaeota archaeon]